MVWERPFLNREESELKDIIPGRRSVIIKPDCRDRLAPEDFEYVAEVLAKKEKDKAIIQSLLSDPDNRDYILEHEALFEKIITYDEVIKISPRLYFYVITRHAFLREEITNPDLADYCSNLLVENIYEHPLTLNFDEMPDIHIYLIDKLYELINASKKEVFLLHYELANEALFVSGVFPDSIRYRQKQKIGPSLRYFEFLGANSYAIASEHKIAIDNKISDILKELSLKFHSVRKGLNRAMSEYAGIGKLIETNVVKALNKNQKRLKK